MQCQPRHQVQAAAVKCHLLAVDVIVAVAAAGQHEIPILESPGRNQVAQLFAKPLEGVAHSDGGVQRNTGCRAAVTSSTRCTGVSWGADCTKARSLSASSTMTAQMSA